MKTIFVILDINAYGMPEIIDQVPNEEEAQKIVSDRRKLGYNDTCYEIVNLKMPYSE